MRPGHAEGKCRYGMGPLHRSTDMQQYCGLKLGVTGHKITASYQRSIVIIVSLSVDPKKLTDRNS